MRNMTEESVPMPSHAIIIPHYNDIARLRRCLDALARDDRGDAEVVVIDNRSDNWPLDLADNYPFARFLVEPQRGAANARNRGVAETSAPVLCFLDCDCVPAPGWSAAALAAAERSDIVGGAIEVFDETPPPRSGAEAFETVFAFDFRRYIEKKGFSVTANLVTTRAVFEAVGQFVHGLSEDAEWCLRAREKGFRLTLDEGMRVSHPSRSDWSSLKRKWRRITDEMFALHMQQRPGPAGRIRWAARAIAMPLSAIVHAPKVLSSRKLTGMRERIVALITLFRLRLQRAVWMLCQVAR